MSVEWGPRRRECGAALLVAGLFLAAWLPWHPARPLMPTADLYTHLSVARHLVRGDGFRTDVTYPLSFAFPFARELPQPLINRQPGFGVLLTLPYLTANGDPARTIVHTRGLQIILLGLTVLIGTRALQKLDRPQGILPWLVLTGASPLLAFAVDWGFDELVVGLILFLVWLDNRNTGRQGPGVRAGVLAGLVVLFRLDLFWIPALWWLLAPRALAAAGTEDRPRRRRLALAALMGLIVVSPWLIRNARLAGSPFFSLQANAELVKDTRAWPAYSVYRNLSPQPLLTSLRTYPVPIMRKAARGLLFYGNNVHRFFPPVLLAGFVAALGLALWRRLHNGAWPSGERGTQALAALTLLLLCLEYALFDHSLRHLLVLLPVLAWETAAAAGKRWDWAALACLTVLLPVSTLPGWSAAEREAAAAAGNHPWEAEGGRIAPNGLYFFEYSAGPWFLDRPGVWRSPAAEAQIPRLLKRVSSPSDCLKERQ